MTKRQFEVSPQFFDTILPYFESKGKISVGEVAVVRRILEEDGPNRAANILCLIQETRDQASKGVGIFEDGGGI